MDGGLVANYSEIVDGFAAGMVGAPDAAALFGCDIGSENAALRIIRDVVCQAESLSLWITKHAG